MGFESATPAVLVPLLLGGCVVLAFLKRMSPVNWLRAVSIALGLLALAGPSVTTDLRLPRVIFLLDESGSYRWASPLETLEEKTRGLPAGTPVMVAGFGAGVRLGPWTPADAFRAESVGAGASESRIGDALKTVAAACPDGVAQVYLFSDGHFTDDWRSLPPQTLKRLRLDAVVLRAPGDAAVKAVDVPPHLTPGRRARLSVRLVASETMRARVSATGARPLVVELGPRERVATLEMEVGEAARRVEIRLSADGDSRSENDAAEVLLVPEARPQILYIGPGGATLQALEARYGRRVTHLPPTGSLALDPATYDAVVLEEVAHDDRPEGFWERLESAVDASGTGLFVLGAERAFAAGGYAGRVSERLLPVNCAPKHRKPLALVVLMDCSASMAQPSRPGRPRTKWKVAVDALVSALRNLSPQDAVATLCFDVGAEEVRPLGRLGPGDLGRMSRRLHERRPGGGTNIYVALEEAAGLLARVNPDARRAVMLLSDGHTLPPPQDFDLEAFVRLKAPIYAIACGAEPNVAVLDAMAKATGGARTDSDFTAAALQAAVRSTLVKIDSPVAEGDFDVRATPPLPSPPKVRRFCRSAAKRPAEVLVEADGHPLLARWRYGAGMVAALTTAPTRSAAPRWLRWPQLQAFLTGVLDGVSRPGGRWWIQARQKGREVVVRCGPKSGEGAGPVTISLGGAKAVEALETEPGVWEARIPVSGEGASMALVRVAGRTAARTAVALLDEERRTVGTDLKRLRILAEAFGGRPMSVTEFLRAEPVGIRRERVALWRWFLYAALVVAIASLAAGVVTLRRLGRAAAGRNS